MRAKKEGLSLSHKLIKEVLKVKKLESPYDVRWDYFGTLETDRQFYNCYCTCGKNALLNTYFPDQPVELIKITIFSCDFVTMEFLMRCYRMRVKRYNILIGQCPVCKTIRWFMHANSIQTRTLPDYKLI